jgi:tripartite-type tricarboxylate transporter receptor subunit TctC
LAVLNPARAAALPEVKTVRELGYAELEIDGMSGIFASSALADAVAERVAGDVAEICRDPQVRGRLEAAGHKVLSGTTGELRSGIERERSRVAEVAKLIDIRNAQ